MSQSPVANHIDNYILSKDLPVLSSNFEHSANIIHIVSVHMENGRINGFCDIRAIKAGPGVMRRRRESDLVVGDHVDGSSDGVVVEILHLHGLENDALSSEGRVSVQQDGHDLSAIVILLVMLLSTHSAHHDGVDALQMRGVGQDRDVQLPPVGVRLRVRRAQMVLHVSRRNGGVVLHVGHDSLEFRKDLFQRLLHDVGEHIESSSVRHAHDDVVCAQF